METLGFAHVVSQASLDCPSLLNGSVGGVGVKEMSAWSEAGFAVVVHRMADGGDTNRLPDPQVRQSRCVDCKQRVADIYWARMGARADPVCRDCLLDRIHDEFLELEFARQREAHS